MIHCLPGHKMCKILHLNLSTYQIDIIPQGPILGPIFFLLYTNDLNNISVYVNFILYDDDTTVLISDRYEVILGSTYTSTMDGISFIVLG